MIIDNKKLKKNNRIINIMTAASPPPPNVLEGIEKIGFSVTHVYGLTESYGPAVICEWNPEWNKINSTKKRANLKSRQGVNYPSLEFLDVFDTKKMKPVKRDGKTLGEVFFRGNIIMKGYLNNNEANKSAFNKSKKIFSCLGKNVLHIGPSGAGQIVKACNNMMLGINMIGVCEAFLLANKFKINTKKFYEICSKSTGSSWAMLNHLPIKGIVESSAANNKFKPGYAARLILKDLKISNEMAKSVKLKASMGNKAHELYKKFCNADKNNLDYAAIIKLISKL